MIYVLILIYNITGQSVQFQSFDSEKTCEEAKTIISKSFETSFVLQSKAPRSLTCIKQ